MNIRIENLQTVDRIKWAKLVEAGSFFQSYDWVDICATGLDGEAVFICSYEREKLIAGFPGIIVKRYGFRSFLSMPFDTYGGVLFSGEFPNDEKENIAAELLSHIRSQNYSAVIITDRKRILRNGVPASAIRTAFTQMVDLGDEPELEPPDKKIMGHIRSGQRLDSQIVDIETDEQVRQFYGLYCETARRHGDKSPRLSLTFFETVFNKLSGSDKMIFIAVMVDQNMVGARLAFIDNKNLINWHMVSDYDSRQYKANHLLMYETMTRAIKRGVRYVNLGASPEDAVGLIDFKKRWGGVQEEYDIITFKSGIRTVIDRWRG